MNNNLPTLDELREILRQECDMRNSDLIQEYYDTTSVNFNSSESVEDFVQSVVLSRSKFSHSTLDQYREALKEDAFFIKHNIMVPFPIEINGCINDLDTALHDLKSLSPITLNDVLSRDKENIILASSST